MIVKSGKSLAGFAGVLMATAAWPAMAFAEAAPPEASSVEEIVVTGALSGVATAIEQQKVSTAVVNVVSSNDFSTLPDINAAEALQRLPGVSLVQSQGEGRYVSIRGARPNYNGTLINGFTVPSGDRAERRVDLQVVPNPLIERIEVHKTITPDLPGDGIGGLVNIVARNPAEIDDFMAGASIFGGVQQYDGSDKRADAFVADRFGKDRMFGFSLAASARESRRKSYANEADGWGKVTGANGEQVWMPEEVTQLAYDIKRRNLGVDAAFGAAFENVKFDVRGFYSKFSSPNQAQALIGAISPTMAGGSPLDLAASGGTVDVDVSRELAVERWELSLGGIQSKMSFNLADNIAVDLGYAYHEAKEGYPVKFSATGGSTDAGSLPLTVRPDLVALGALGGAPPAALLPGASTLTQVDNAPRDDSETEHTPYVNVKATFDLDSRGSLELKGGAYFRFRDKKTEIIQTRHKALGGADLSFADLVENGGDTIIKRGVYYGALGDGGYARSVLDRNPGAWGPEIQVQPRGIDAKDYNATEDIQAYYAMATWTRGPLTLIGGGRYEQTDTTFLRASKETANGLKYFEGEDSHFLPSLHLRYELRPELVLRASWSNTIARPDPEMVYANEDIDREERVITRANPDLKPLESTNFDASVDWYFGALSYVSVGVFKKDISNFPLVTQQKVQFEGQLYDQLTTQSDADGELQGFEAAYRQQFTNLPGLFSGLGVEVNYAHIDSKLIYAKRPDKPPLQQQPSDVLNASLVYALDKVYLRLALARVGRQIAREGMSDDGPDFDMIVDAKTTLDLSFRYDLTDNVQFYGEWRNITNEPEVNYTGDKSRLASWQSFGSSGGVGLRVRF